MIVIERVLPMQLLLGGAVAEGPRLSDEEMLELLHEHGAAAVMSPAEDRQITKAGYSRAMPPRWVVGGDPWSRVRAAGQDPQTFRPSDRRSPKLRGTRSPAALPSAARAAGDRALRLQASAQKPVLDPFRACDADLCMTEAPIRLP